MYSQVIIVSVYGYIELFEEQAKSRYLLKNIFTLLIKLTTNKKRNIIIIELGNAAATSSVTLNIRPWIKAVYLKCLSQNYFCNSTVSVSI